MADHRLHIQWEKGKDIADRENNMWLKNSRQHSLSKGIAEVRYCNYLMVYYPAARRTFISSTDVANFNYFLATFKQCYHGVY